MNKRILDEKELFIFDLDGTVCDTEPCHHAAYVRTIESLCPGHTIPAEEFLTCYVGHSETEIYSLLKRNKGIEFDNDLFFNTRIKNLFEIVRERCLDCAPFYRQLEALYPNRRFIALTSQRVSVLERFRELVDYGKIEEFISVADKPYGKKDVLADTESYLGVPQDKCVIFEDFAPTLRAAMENGVYAVGICHDFNALSREDCDEMTNIHKEAVFS
ncbi:MAG: HAD family phosphatase [Clostridia bacterium]|nr:HAD family phosphatase [Clostridia bacterium]